MAFIGEAEEPCCELIHRLAAAGYPLVLIAKEDMHFARLAEDILDRLPQADIETIDCVKEACWEADVVVFNDLKSFDAELLEKVKAVVNQKILVYFLKQANQSSILLEKRKGVRRSLSNAVWVQVIFDGGSGELHIGGDENAAAIVEGILDQAGYKTTPLEAV